MENLLESNVELLKEKLRKMAQDWEAIEELQRIIAKELPTEGVEEKIE